MQHHLINILEPGLSPSPTNILFYPSNFCQQAVKGQQDLLSLRNISYLSIVRVFFNLLILCLLVPLDSHGFKKMEFQPPEAKKFFSTVRKEMALLATSLPDGIMVKTFEDRMVSLPKFI